MFPPRDHPSRKPARLFPLCVGGEVVVVFVTATARVVANNAVERILSTRVRSDNTMRTDGTGPNPALTLFRDRVFVQLGSGRVVNGTLTTEGSITVSGAVFIVAEFLGLRRQ